MDNNLERLNYLEKDKDSLLEERKKLLKEVEPLQKEYDSLSLGSYIAYTAVGGVLIIIALVIGLTFAVVGVYDMVFLLGFIGMTLLFAVAGIVLLAYGLTKMGAVKETRDPLSQKIGAIRRRIKYIDQALLVSAQNKSLSKALNEQSKQPGNNQETKTDTEQELTKLKDLFEKGLITEEEYSEAKKKILGI